MLNDAGAASASSRSRLRPVTPLQAGLEQAAEHRLLVVWAVFLRLLCTAVGTRDWHSYYPPRSQEQGSAGEGISGIRMMALFSLDFSKKDFFKRKL